MTSYIIRLILQEEIIIHLKMQVTEMVKVMDGGLYQNGSFGEYSYGRSSLVNNYTRVYKGGGWKDDAYWLSPGARRHLNQDLSAEFIGFRCVLDHMGWESSKDQKDRDQKQRLKENKTYLKGLNN